MSSIYGASPWTKAAVDRLDVDERAAIDAAVPAGMFVTIGAAGRPGRWTIYLMEGEYGAAKPVARVDGVYNIPNGVKTAVARWRAMP